MTAPRLYLSSVPLRSPPGSIRAERIDGGPAGAQSGAIACLDIPPGGSIAWDELDTSIAPQTSPWDPVARLIGAARNLRVNLLLASKVPAIVPATTRAAWDILLYVPWTEPRYADWLASQGLPLEPLRRWEFHAAYWERGNIATMRVRNDSLSDISALLRRAEV